MSDLWSLFCRVADRHPQRAALEEPSGVTTYAQLRRRAHEVQAQLLKLGVQAGDRVLLRTHNSAEVAAGILGAWAAGGIAALLDVRAAPSHLAHAVTLITPRVILQPRGASDPSASIGGTAVLELEGIAATADIPPAVPRMETDAASIMFTSGSTGAPKGVIQSHGNLARGCAAVMGYLGVTAQDRLYCPIPWSFDYGFGQLHMTLTQGVTQITEATVNPFNVVPRLADSGATVLAGLASLYPSLLAGAGSTDPQRLRALRLVMNTGGRVAATNLTRLRALLPSVPIVLNYGLTETYRTCYLRPDLLDTHAHTLGHPIPGVDIAIADEQGRPVPPGEPGEIVHRGDYICLGYWNHPEATARALRPDPLAAAPAVRALFTGDYGHRDAEGFVHFQGRRDRQLKAMGVRVSPEEIERLLGASGLVAEAALLGLPHEVLGDELVAVVVPLPDADQAALNSALRNWARDALSPPMRPQRWLIRSELPRTTSGKTNYPALREQLTAPRPA